MPWLAELVESSEGSLDVLPVQCLCEFLLHESQDVPRDAIDDESAKFEKHKKRQVSSCMPEMKIVEFANSVDSNEAAQDEPPHLNLHCLAFCL